MYISDDTECSLLASCTAFEVWFPSAEFVRFWQICLFARFIVSSFSAWSMKLLSCDGIIWVCCLCR